MGNIFYIVISSAIKLVLASTSPFLFEDLDLFNNNEDLSFITKISMWMYSIRKKSIKW